MVDRTSTNYIEVDGENFYLWHNGFRWQVHGDGMYLGDLHWEDGKWRVSINDEDLAELHDGEGFKTKESAARFIYELHGY